MSHSPVSSCTPPMVPRTPPRTPPCSLPPHLTCPIVPLHPIIPLHHSPHPLPHASTLCPFISTSHTIVPQILHSPLQLMARGGDARCPQCTDVAVPIPAHPATPLPWQLSLKPSWVSGTWQWDRWGCRKGCAGQCPCCTPPEARTEHARSQSWGFWAPRYGASAAPGSVPAAQALCHIPLSSHLGVALCCARLLEGAVASSFLPAPIAAPCPGSPCRLHSSIVQLGQDRAEFSVTFLQPIELSVLGKYNLEAHSTGWSQLWEPHGVWGAGGPPVCSNFPLQLGLRSCSLAACLGPCPSKHLFEVNRSGEMLAPSTQP